MVSSRPHRSHSCLHHPVPSVRIAETVVPFLQRLRQRLPSVEPVLGAARLFDVLLFRGGPIAAAFENLQFEFAQPRPFQFLLVGRIVLGVIHGWCLGSNLENGMEVVDLILASGRRHDKGPQGAAQQGGKQGRVAVEKGHFPDAALVDKPRGTVQTESRNGAHGKAAEAVRPNVAPHVRNGANVVLRERFGRCKGARHDAAAMIACGFGRSIARSFARSKVASSLVPN